MLDFYDFWVYKIGNHIVPRLKGEIPDFKKVKPSLVDNDRRGFFYVENFKERIMDSDEPNGYKS